MYGRNVVISEGNRPSRIQMVNKILTDGQEPQGDTTWVPKSERTRKSLWVHSNGTYYASEDGAYCWDTVTVGVYGGNLIDGIDPVPPSGIDPITDDELIKEIEEIDPIELDEIEELIVDIVSEIEEQIEELEEALEDEELEEEELEELEEEKEALEEAIKQIEEAETVEDVLDAVDSIDEIMDSDLFDELEDAAKTFDPDDPKDAEKLQPPVVPTDSSIRGVGDDGRYTEVSGDGSEKVVKGGRLVVERLPFKVFYSEGESLDLTNLSVSAYGDDGEAIERDIPHSKLTFSPNKAEFTDPDAHPDFDGEAQVLTMMWTYDAMGTTWPDEVVVSNVQGAEYEFAYNPEIHQTRSPVHCNGTVSDRNGAPIYYANIDHYGNGGEYGPHSSVGQSEIAAQYFVRTASSGETINIDVAYNYQGKDLHDSFSITVMKYGGIRRA